MKDHFRRQDSYWAWLYKRTMQGKGNGDENLDCQAIQDVQTSIVEKLSGRSGSGVPDPKLLYDPILQDGEYVSSDENEQ